ncbi:MAG: hypothetical protein FE78DRAFT_484932 [Acidomyces sp. 'richmondensis']|nr:MAG: hypothetical protein FE78DRAFT_484932 [Acidomyces sp. 'richmondensis']
MGNTNNNSRRCWRLMFGLSPLLAKQSSCTPSSYLALNSAIFCDSRRSQQGYCLMQIRMISSASASSPLTRVTPRSVDKFGLALSIHGLPATVLPDKRRLPVFVRRSALDWHAAHTCNLARNDAVVRLAPRPRLIGPSLGVTRADVLKPALNVWCRGASAPRARTSSTFLVSPSGAQR